MALLATSALAACAGGIGGIPRVASTVAGARSMSANGTSPAVSPAGAQSMAPMSNPCSDVPNSVGVGGMTTMSSCQDCQTSGTCQTCPNGSQGDACGVGAPGPPPGWNNCVIGCNPGNPGDPINVGPPCQPISSCIAMRQPTSGAPCYGSPVELGDQYPGTTKDYAHEIVNIFPVFANNQTGNEDVVAWEYTMGAGNMYIQGNQSFQGFWQDLTAGAFGTAAAFESGGISGMNSNQASQVEKYAASHHGSVGTTACFSHNLPPTQA